ncbi:hypothetical protein JQ557_30705 [Bradyrhizobium sp. U87765 SZCCT0131]|uniref:hypothetical protein n=1 Tax=unclassified Bradyrhizobium TaxID=2631580 RepID=UPI001BA996EA|nr:MULTISPECIES: hypothetical protein [unclassified Bradyrhizobium]MBR1222406.1 hypothetical protein [Bradyrhizobium sp. U87765 SZCCT0131]MBR1264110.1 hypothetical protein [Bradyrhizobium sp. U87765 SZCCT0134]MBR1308107.1 hypothetical protein [Bradyrhizobium sp. U87765 SZCCT0110]MBR1320360.1 hypothetical protein [Bradyrhizobium sp. U87765 SZCCT0109]MBR1348527.1 hypothetical protein [Bradyrhizobium sp. U87765 SZCCT0048]
MKTFLIAATCGLLISSSSAFAACTQADLTKKATDLQAAMTAYLQKNPAKANEVMTRTQAISAKYQSAANAEEACKAYDELTASLK